MGCSQHSCSCTPRGVYTLLSKQACSLLSIHAWMPHSPHPLSAVPIPQVGGTLIGADLLAGAPLMHLPGTVGVVVWCGLILPAAYVLAASFANLLFKDALVLKASRCVALLAGLGLGRAGLVCQAAAQGRTRT